MGTITAQPTHTRLLSSWFLASIRNEETEAVVSNALPTKRICIGDMQFTPPAPQALMEFQVEAGKEQAGQSGPSWWTPGLSSKQLRREGQMWLCDSWSPEKRCSFPSYPHILLLLQGNWKKLSPRRHPSARPRHLSFLGPSETTGTARVPLPFKRRGSRRNLWPRARTLVSSTPLLE